MLAFAAAAAAGCGPRAPDRLPSSTGTGPRPAAPWGGQSGDVDERGAVVWTRSDRDARLLVSWPRRDAAAAHVTEVVGAHATAASDFTAKARLEGLPADARVAYELELVSASGARSERVRGTFRTPPRADDRHPRDVVFAWSGDVNGQGFGIGKGADMPAYAALRDAAPDLFLHLGDAIYADDPIERIVRLPDGGTWENDVLTAAKAHVAETLDDFRGAFLYPRHSKLFREAAAEVPVVHVWDDHEVHDNWWPGMILDDERYTERAIDVLAVRARRAMYEHVPTVRDASLPMWRSLRMGVHVEVFLVDGRSQRTPNQPEPAKESFFGDAQVAWLTEAISRSTATWKVVASDMPISLAIAERRRGGGPLASDGIANAGATAAPSGREPEIARLLADLHRRGVRNLVWLGADVHYACAQRLDPARAATKGFSPFHELVAGPMHAGAFPQKPLDETFGPEVLWSNAGPTTMSSPADPTSQTFGLARVEGRSGTMIVRFVDGTGRTLHELRLVPS